MSMLFIIFTSPLLWYVQIAVCISIGCFRCVLKFKVYIGYNLKDKYLLFFNMRFNETINLRYNNYILFKGRVQFLKWTFMSVSFLFFHIFDFMSGR